MSDLPVLRAGQRRELVLDGTRYAVRALSYAEHGALQLSAGARRAPSAEVINDALRRAAERAGRADLAEAIDQAEAAEDALSALFDSRPPRLDEEGQRAWHEANAPELRRVEEARLRAARRRRLAVEMFADAEEVAVLRAKAADALRGAALDLVVAGLLEVDGRPVTMTAETAGSLPAAHVGALAEAISEMLRPSQDAAKN